MPGGGTLLTVKCPIPGTHRETNARRGCSRLELTRTLNRLPLPTTILESTGTKKKRHIARFFHMCRYQKYYFTLVLFAQVSQVRITWHLTSIKGQVARAGFLFILATSAVNSCAARVRLVCSHTAKVLPKSKTSKAPLSSFVELWSCAILAKPGQNLLNKHPAIVKMISAVESMFMLGLTPKSFFI